MATKKKSGTLGNFVSEWFGHRIFPMVVSSKQFASDQSTERCPFLSAATGETRICTKAEASKGVCTISSSSNGPRQDWLVCPYRALSAEIVVNAIRKLFAVPVQIDPFVVPAIALTKSDVRTDIASRLSKSQPVFIYGSSGNRVGDWGDHSARKACG